MTKEEMVADRIKIYNEGLKDGRDSFLELLQQEGGEVRLYALFEKDRLVEVSENKKDLADREDTGSGMVIAEKTIKITWEQNKWIRRGEWYPYGRQWRSKNCYNHPLTDKRGYAQKLIQKRGSDKVVVTRRCLFCNITEDYVIPSKDVKHLSSYGNL